jgi:hypothetical protein
MGLVSPKLRASARGEDCTFQIPGVCNRNPETVVLCHIADERKGLGNKSDDYSAAFGCSSCHEAIDQHRLSAEDELFFKLRGMQRTWRRWVETGLIKLPGRVA